MNIVETLGVVVRRIWSRAAPRSDRGASSIEYGMMASLIAAVIIAAVFFLGQATDSNFNCTSDSIEARTTQC